MEAEKNQPLVSVITGYYNRENLVDESIQSLLDQTYPNLEIIIFDDCSTDNTLKELQKFESDPRIQIIAHKQNQGFTRALIHAIQQSKGEFIAIHGSGDYSYPERVGKQVAALLENEKYSIVGCEDEKVFKDGTISVTARWPPRNFYNSMIRKGKRPLNGSHIMVKRNYYEMVGGYREFFTYAQDSDLLCRLSLVSDYTLVPQVLYRQWRHVEGSVSGDPIKRIKQIFYMELGVECMKMRKKLGYDHIDMLGKESFLAFKGNKNLTDKLSTHAIKLYNDNRKKEFFYLVRIIDNLPQTAQSTYLKLLSKKIISAKLNNSIYGRAKSVNRNSFVKWLKLKFFNVNKV
ncbi:glycosyltransferase family 2 protein [Cyclobacterium sp. SYSU L10401]|uniref:glycosyltransferase family 2 protein n=1 Tax=Cyclobacterium sp. SYSU L10401 TaxID=2678657 RepID=UPI0013D1C13D|nr:glycosyltransferase family 2 protein [Cyclobacterium sp. SYSU L10401]